MKIYLAIPYSFNHELGFRAANKMAARLIDQGHIVYSPISMSHPIQQYMTQSNTFETWMKQDLEFIDWCDEVHVVHIGEMGMELIEKSKGVTMELNYAKKHDKPIKIIEYYE